MSETVHVVTCCDPSDAGSELWAHGAYATMAQARRVYQRLKDDTCWTVRINTLRIQRPRQPKRKVAQR